ncbi:rngB, partial [Symbiodinium necroappetens]
ANYWEQLSPSTAPPERYAHTAVWSAAANGFYVFGGNDGNVALPDLRFYGREASEGHRLLLARGTFFVKYWQIPAPQGVLLGPVNSWEQTSSSGPYPYERMWHSAVWSPAANGFYVFGGISDSPGPESYMLEYSAGVVNTYIEDNLWFYGREASSWEYLSPSGTTPPERYAHTAVWSAAENGFYVYGGNDGHKYYGVLDDLWFYGREVNSWEQLSWSGYERMWHSAVWSPAANGFYVFGGHGSGPGHVLGDLLFYGREANSWELPSPSGTAPPARYGHTAVWSAAANGFYVFGGNGDGGLGPESTHVSQANSWEQLSPSGTAPPERYGHTAVWSAAANGFYVFGGNDGSLGPESTSGAAQQPAMLHDAALRCVGGGSPRQPRSPQRLVVLRA